MKVARLKTTNEFCFSYVKLNNNVFRASDIAAYFPNKQDKILTELKNSEVSNTFVKPFVYPSYNTMETEVKKEVKKLMVKLNLQPSKKQLDELQNAAKVFDYFATTLQYNRLMQEERGNHFEDSDAFFKALKLSKARLEKFNLKPAKMNSADRAFYRMNKAFTYNVVANEQNNLKNNMDLRKLSYMKGLYNVFVRGGGVCSDFTNAFHYVLNELGITTYKVIKETKTGVGSVYHDYGLVELNNLKEKQYYAYDLTKAILDENYHSKKQQGELAHFGLGKYETIHHNDTILTIQKQVGMNEGEFYPQIEEKILEKKLPQTLTAKLIENQIALER